MGWRKTSKASRKAPPGCLSLLFPFWCVIPVTPLAGRSDWHSRRLCILRGRDSCWESCWKRLPNPFEGGAPTPLPHLLEGEGAEAVPSNGECLMPSHCRVSSRGRKSVAQLMGAWLHWLQTVSTRSREGNVSGGRERKGRLLGLQPGWRGVSGDCRAASSGKWGRRQLPLAEAWCREGASSVSPVILAWLFLAPVLEGNQNALSRRSCACHFLGTGREKPERWDDQYACALERCKWWLQRGLFFPVRPF